MGVVFDLETPPVEDFASLRGVDRLLCLAVADEDGGAPTTYHGDSLGAGVDRVLAADRIVGHNVLRFDVPVLERVFRGGVARSRVVDTIVLSRLGWPDLYDRDQAVRVVPQHLAGSHSLEAWGHRVGERKDVQYRTSEEAWTELTPELLAYCAQDVQVNRALWSKIRGSRFTPPAAVANELAFADHLAAQERRGAGFDLARAEEVAGELEARRFDLEECLAAMIPPFVDEYVTPVKRERRVRSIPFNPRSAAHKIRHFAQRRDWRPKARTETGRPKMDEAVLRSLSDRGWPEVALLLEHAKLTKVLGYVVDGAAAWVKLVTPEGRVHGQITHIGTITHRCAHKRPNLGNVPKTGELGQLCRSMFVASPSHRLVGCDASGLQLRLLGHYLHEWDGGEYARLVDEGDVHQHTADVLGLDREVAKRVMYATLFGAGDAKIARVAGQSKGVRDRLLSGIRGLAELSERCQATECLEGLDGRRVPVRHRHAALNSLLMSAEAVVMRRAVINMHRAIPDFRQVLFVHDEVQAEAPEDLVAEYREAMEQSIRDAGTDLALNVPLRASSKDGANWAETH